MQVTPDIQIRSYMTPMPKTVGSEQTLEFASHLMRELGVRHLPVLKGGELVGVISERDINFLLTFEDRDALNLKVEEAMSPDPYFTPSDRSLSEVASAMARHKYGSALVMDGGRVVGIFTAIDALRILPELIERKGNR